MTSGKVVYSFFMDEEAEVEAGEKKMCFLIVAEYYYSQAKK